MLSESVSSGPTSDWRARNSNCPVESGVKWKGTRATPIFAERDLLAGHFAPRAVGRAALERDGQRLPGQACAIRSRH